MTNSQLLRAYKENKMISIKREYAGCYIATVGEYIFRIENAENREVSGNEWLITSVKGSKDHDEMDPYITHRFSLQDAQIWLVNNY